jgi:hypothetical protein
MHASAAAEPRMVEQKGMALVQGTLKHRTVPMLTTLTTSLNISHTDRDLRDPTGPSSRGGWSLVTSLVASLLRKARQPSTTWTCDSIDTSVRWGDPRLDEAQRRLAQHLVPVAATSVPAAAGDGFGATCWEGEAGAPVTVGLLPARGRPEAARGAGLEFVGKVLTRSSPDVFWLG